MAAQVPPQEKRLTLRTGQVAEARSPERQYTVVVLGGHLFAVDVSHTVQIIERPMVTPVPHTPAFVLGVCNVRGDIFSVVDIRHLLGLGPPPENAGPDPLVVVMRGERYTCGFSIERISELMWIRDDRIAAPTTDIPFVSGLHRHNRDTILVLDVEALLESPEMMQFQ